MSDMALLVFLYAIQGVPLGLSMGSIPFLLKSVSSFADIGVFSFAAYPYSLKLLWSPIVDSVYSYRIGRRKSWIIPIQLCVGLLFMLLSSWTDAFFRIEERSLLDVVLLTLVFFVVVTLVATQDIAVDGWALSLLSEEHRGYASTCQSIGLNIGFFSSYSVFLALNSASFCNEYIREYMDLPSTDTGVVSIGDYMWFWGIVMILASLLLLFKTETSSSMRYKSRMDEVKQVYQRVYSILQLPNMQQLALVLLTARLGFAVADNVTLLKLTEKGFPREALGLTVLITFPFEIVFPILIGRFAHASPENTLSPFKAAYPLRIILSLVGIYAVYTLPSPEEISAWTYARILFLQIAYSLTSNMMFTAQCAFFARISDESMGGTYMTLLNTMGNLGGTWPKFFVLYLVDAVSVGDMDGYYVLGITFALVGFLWLYFFDTTLDEIQQASDASWHVERSVHMTNVYHMKTKDE